MILHLLQYFTGESLLTNLFRYISFRTLTSTVISFFLVILLMPRLIRYLRSFSVGQVVRDDGPQSHFSKKGTPTMGGLLILIAVTLTSLLLCRLENFRVWIALFVFIGFGMVGFWDDFLKFTKKNSKGVSAKLKLLSLGLVSLLAVAWATQIHDHSTVITLPFFKEVSVDIGLWIFLWGYLVLVGASNAVNLTDGLDGLAIVPIMTTGVVLLILSYVMGHSIFSNYLQFQFLPGAGELCIIMGALLGAGLGFLWFNCHPAQVFMGDVGSLSMGGLLAAVALLTHQELVLLIAGFLFVIEALSVMVQVGFFKASKGKRILRMAPIHHHFELGGWPESKVIIRFWILSILFALAALSTLKIR